VLDLTGWRVSGEKGAAKVLGLKPTTFEARMKKLKIKRIPIAESVVAVAEPVMPVPVIPSPRVTG
jgi:hypothetical protein